MANIMTSTTPATSTDPESADEVFINENVPAVNTNTPSIDKPKTSSDLYKRLSTISRMYDVDGDGQLNDAEMAIRCMDQSNRGYLTNDKVCALMIEQLETQKQLFKVKRIMLVLLALVFVLAFANLGTSFAAASLAKDTTTSSTAALMDKKTNEAVSTQTTSDSLTIERAIITPDGRRKLCDVDGDDAECKLSDRNSILSMNQRSCRRMVRLCDQGNTVSLTRTWRNGDKTSFNVCPYTGTLSTDNLSELTNRHGIDFTFEEIRGGHCKIGGDALLQPQGRICELSPDCAPDLSCAEVESFIETCQYRCGLKRWAPSRVESCKANCRHPSCVAAPA